VRRAARLQAQADAVLGVYARDADGAAEIALRRAVLAHQLGHHHLHAGIYLSPYRCRRRDLDASRVETQAERRGRSDSYRPR